MYKFTHMNRRMTSRLAKQGGGGGIPIRLGPASERTRKQARKVKQHTLVAYIIMLSYLPVLVWLVSHKSHELCLLAFELILRTLIDQSYSQLLLIYHSHSSNTGRLVFNWWAQWSFSMHILSRSQTCFFIQGLHAPVTIVGNLYVSFKISVRVFDTKRQRSIWNWLKNKKQKTNIEFSQCSTRSNSSHTRKDSNV